MQYKVKKTCTLPGSLRYVEAGEIVELTLPKGQKVPRHLEPIKKKTQGNDQASQATSSEPDHSRPEDLG